MRRTQATVVLLAIISSGCEPSRVTIEHDVAVTMRDKVILRADVYRPRNGDSGPVLVYRTPYGKHNAAKDYQTHLHAVERGYVVVLQDVRGRHASDGIFDPYRNEGNDGYDTIEWAADQPWSNGDVGTYGLSYPGAVQWLAAIQSPPHLKAMVPAMTFSSPRNFFYMNGVFDLSWLPWVYFNIAPDARVRRGMQGPQSYEGVAEQWENEHEEILNFLPLVELPQLHDEAPFYFEWLEHAPNDPWWDWAEIRGHYEKTNAAVLNMSGWYDEAYGPEGATTNFNGLVAARDENNKTNLIMGPWQHGVDSVEQQSLGVLDFGPESTIDYDEEILRFFDRYLKPPPAVPEDEPAVRYFVMGANEWRTTDQWPPQEVRPRILCLSRSATQAALKDCGRPWRESTTTFSADPKDPVVDPYGSFEAHDFQGLAARDDVIVFETEPLQEAVTIAGNTSAHLFVSCDCADFDLWVRLLDVYPDGRAINLMSPGADVQRMSLRGGGAEVQLLNPNDIYEVDLDGLLTANQFAAGHRIRIQISASFAPHLSRNLQTGQSEVNSSASAVASITVHHSNEFASTIELPVVD